MNHVIICTVGRSGSTLMQGILNTIDGYCVRGENNNFLIGIYLSYLAIDDAYKNMAPALEPTHPWYGAGKLDPERFLNSQRNIFYEQMAAPEGTTTLGFKEIRWSDEYLFGRPLESYMFFLTKLLPSVKFVLLTRNVDEIYQSQIRAGFNLNEPDYNSFRDHIEIFYDNIRKIKVNLFEIDYSQLSVKSEKLADLFYFLGAACSENHLEKVFKTDHSYANSRRYAD